MMPFPKHDATRAEIDAWYHQRDPERQAPHEVPAAENGPSLVCNACNQVRIPWSETFCEGCKGQLEAAGVEVP